MGYEAYEKKSKGVVILVIVILIALGLVCYLYYDRYMKPNQNDNTPKETTPVEEEIDYDELTDEPLNKESDYDLTLSNGKFLSDVTDEKEYNEWLTKNRELYDKITKEYKKLFSYGAYDIYENKEYKEEGSANNYSDEYKLNLNSIYFALNTKNKLVLEVMPFGKESEKSDFLYVITSPVKAIGIMNTNTKRILVGYDDYSCHFHSDVSFMTCSDKKTTMISKYNDVTKKNERGIISINSLRTIIEPTYEEINEINESNYLVFKDNKNGLIDKKGKNLIDLDYEYLAYNKYLGFVTIKNNTIELLDNNLNKVNKDIKAAFDEAIKKYNSDAIKNDLDQNKLFMIEANSYYWTVGSEMQYTDISKEIDKKDNDFRYIYTGNKYSGNQLIINSTCMNKNSYIYVISNNTVDKILNNELKFHLGENGVEEEPYCF